MFFFPGLKMWTSRNVENLENPKISKSEKCWKFWKNQNRKIMLSLIKIFAIEISGKKFLNIHSCRKVTFVIFWDFRSDIRTWLHTFVLYKNTFMCAHYCLLYRNEFVWMRTSDQPRIQTTKNPYNKQTWISIHKKNFDIWYFDNLRFVRPSCNVI